MITYLGKKYPHLKKKDIEEELEKELYKREIYYFQLPNGTFNNFCNEMFSVLYTPNEVWEVWEPIKRKYFGGAQKIR